MIRNELLRGARRSQERIFCSLEEEAPKCRLLLEIVFSKSKGPRMCWKLEASCMIAWGHSVKEDIPKGLTRDVLLDKPHSSECVEWKLSAMEFCIPAGWKHLCALYIDNFLSLPRHSSVIRNSFQFMFFLKIAPFQLKSKGIYKAQFFFPLERRKEGRRMQIFLNARQKVGA